MRASVPSVVRSVSGESFGVVANLPHARRHPTSFGTLMLGQHASKIEPMLAVSRLRSCGAPCLLAATIVLISCARADDPEGSGTFPDASTGDAEGGDGWKLWTRRYGR